MNDNVNQKISCFIDDELNANEALDLLKSFQSQPKLNTKFNRYQVAAYALSSKKILPVKANFLAHVQQEIAKETLYFLPRHAPPKKTCKTFIALAACLALIAVLVSGIMYDKPLKLNTLSALMIALVNQQPSLDNKHVEEKLSTLPSKRQQKTDQNNRFNDYLQAHNTSLYTNGKVIVQPAIHTASYRQN